MKVPIVQLTLPDDVLEEVKSVLKSGMWAGGNPVKQLEENFANYCETKYCKAVNNGTSALMAIFGTLGLEPGDEVIIPSFSFIATANCLVPFGLKPVFADIDNTTFNLSPESIEGKITSKTKAIMPVHLYGLCAEMKKIEEIAEKNNLIVIEDACQAHGAELSGKKAGNLGKVAAFSLYPTKNMFCGGEGGLITTSDEDLYGKLNLFVNHGQKEKYIHTEVGYNFRMMAVTGIIAKYSLNLLNQNNDIRIKNAKIYNDILGNVDGVTIPTHSDKFKHVYHQYTIRTLKRDKLAEIFQKEQIGYGVHYKIPIHLQELYKKLGYKETLPNTEKASNEVISLPVHSLLNEEQIKFVAETVRKFHL
ncbi:MAG: DegT/DnrJ/EryC1/StrS family aminotransferase [archaeon]|nr:DegT/DnrJ/EryC1/StrS family aminotransferase [archaeon]